MTASDSAAGSHNTMTHSLRLLKTGADFSALDANALVGNILKFKPVSSQLYSCSSVIPSFSIITCSLLLKSKKVGGLLTNIHHTI